MTLVRRSLALIAMLALGSCGQTQQPTPPATQHPQAAVAPAGGVPLLSARTPRAPERTDPPAVRRQFARESAQALAQLRRLQRARPSAAGGCVRLRGPFQGSWGPPTPRVRATVLGHQVAVEFSFDAMPSSPWCLPVQISAAVFSGLPATSGYNALGATAQFPLAGRSGRFLVPLPGGDPPYHVAVFTWGPGGERSNQSVLPLPCNGRCLPPGPPANGLPEPILAPHGVTRASLARSFAQSVAHPNGWARASGVSCPSLRVCQIAWHDSVERVRFTVRYAVAGERAPGCWIARARAMSGAVPHWPPTVGNSLYLGGCVRWAR